MSILLAGLWPYILAGGGILLGIFGLAARRSGVNSQKAKEAASRAQTLEDIRRASVAVPARDILHDENNRDNRKP